MEDSEVSSRSLGQNFICSGASKQLCNIVLPMTSTRTGDYAVQIMIMDLRYEQNHWN